MAATSSIHVSSPRRWTRVLLLAAGSLVAFVVSFAGTQVGG